MKTKHLYLSLILVVAGFLNTSYANDDDDDILLFLPAILAGVTQCDAADVTACNNSNACEKANGYWYIDSCHSTPNPLSLTQIKKLPGDWYFDSVFSSDGTTSTDEFRFYRSTIALIDNTSSGIDGDQFLGDFSFVYEDDVAAAYDSDASFFVVLSLWGPPTYDSGSAYIFKSAGSNTRNFDCHYNTNGQGVIDSYYIGFGGTIECDPLTKRLKSAAKDNLTQPMASENDPDIVNEDRWQQHLNNIEMNKERATEGLDLKVYSGNSSEIQKIVNKLAEKL